MNRDVRSGVERVLGERGLLALARFASLQCSAFSVCFEVGAS